MINLIDSFRADHTLEESIKNAFLGIEGSASCAFLDEEDNTLILASNNGSIYYFMDRSTNFLLFTSEYKALKDIVEKNFKNKDFTDKTYQVKADSLIKLDLSTFETTQTYGTKNDVQKKISNRNKNTKYYKITDYSSKDYPDFDSIKRCSKCLLPYTFPYISFNKKGVCNYCENYQPQGKRDHNSIKELVKPYRELKNSFDQNCIVGLSGGRDSCYGVHYVKEVLGLNPVAFTYDWGMVTDIARRNIFRMCGELGVEHILVSADIRKKRLNVKKNIEAWLKKPELFISFIYGGDKQFYLHAHRLRKIWILNYLCLCRKYT